jgi:hypothetical protein
MQKLTNKEEEIMHILWKLKKAFVKEILEEISNERIICYYGYALRKVPDSDNYQILKL